MSICTRSDKRLDRLILKSRAFASFFTIIFLLFFKIFWDFFSDEKYTKDTQVNTDQRGQRWASQRFGRVGSWISGQPIGQCADPIQVGCVDPGLDSDQRTNLPWLKRRRLAPV